MNPAHNTSYLKSTTLRIVCRGPDRALGSAGPLAQNRPASSLCAKEEDGCPFRQGKGYARGDWTKGQQDPSRKRWASFTIRAPLNPLFPNRSYSASLMNSSTARQQSYRLFTSIASNDNVKRSLRLRAVTSSAMKQEQNGECSRGKSISWSVGKWNAQVEERRVGSGLVSLGHSIARWTIRFARISTAGARQARHLVRSRRQRRLRPLVRYTLVNKASTAKGWKEMSQNTKHQLWYPALVHALRFDPQEAMVILDDNLTNEGRFFPDYVAKDCLYHLARVYLQDIEDPPQSSANALQRISCFYLSTYGRLQGSASLSQETVYLLSKHCERERFLTFLDCLQHNKAYIHTNTKLHLMARCASLGKIGVALSLLETIPVAELAGDPAQSFCVSMLRAEMEVDDLYGLRSNILAFMLNEGVRPNRQLANVIILNAMEAGDLNTAWRSHEIAQENGLLPNAFTYTCLLKGAQHGDDRAKISYVHKCAATDGSLATSERLRFEILYATYIAEERGPHWRPFMDLLPLYREFFDVQPLIDLGILDYRQDPMPGHAQEAPHVQALGLMILAWLHRHHDISQVEEVYEAYVQHVRAQHPVIAQLAKTDHTANAFMHAFGSHARTLALCTQVIQHMLKPDLADRPAELGDANAEESEPHLPDRSTSPRTAFNIAAPTVQTWSILLHSFIRNRQAVAAEKVLTIMQARGHEPSQVTWNTLLGGYASMQDVAGVVKSIRRLEKDDMEADEWTMKALRRVTDREALLEAFGRNSEGRLVRGVEDDWKQYPEQTW